MWMQSAALALPARRASIRLSITQLLSRSSMASTERLKTHQKALRINLDPTSYGSSAEIGAGQEVVRWFLVVGGASGTVAKSISAYDKEVSGDLYGSGARYVSGERLQATLDSQWAQLINQLNKSRGSNARFHHPPLGRIGASGGTPLGPWISSAARVSSKMRPGECHP
jgi:hypothetical protein